MMTRVTLAAALLAILAAPLGATEVLDRREGRPGVFPVLAAETLRGRPVRLPDELLGERNLLLVAYQREQQQEVDTWLAALDSFTLTPPTFAYYELPCLPAGMRWMRAVIDGGMRQGIPDRAQRDRVITLYLDVAWFRAQIGTAAHDSIAALLVDREGTILRRWYGRYDEAAGAQLRAALTAP